MSEQEVPAYVGGEDPWLYLQPEGDELVAELYQKGSEARLEVALTLQRCFGGAAGNEALAQIRKQAGLIPTFIPGWSTEQLAPCLIRRQAIMDMCDWIEQEMRKV